MFNSENINSKPGRLSLSINENNHRYSSVLVSSLMADLASCSSKMSVVSRACQFHEKVKVGKDQEKAQSEKDSHSKNRGGKKNKLTIRYLYHENIS